MHVDVQLRQRTDIDLVLRFIRNLLCQFSVQRVDAFDDDELIFVDLRDPVAEHFLSFEEIEFRKIDFLACQQIVHVAAEQVDVHGAQVLEIQFAVFIRYHIFPVDKVIIGAHVDWTQSVDPELDAKPSGKCGLAG